YQYRLSEINKYDLHECHTILANREKDDLIDGIITQNEDALHLDAGNENVMELHGSYRDMHCHESTKQSDRASNVSGDRTYECEKQSDRASYLAGESTCECGGTIRPVIVLLGESLPQKTFKLAEQLTKQADLFIVLGSSLSVSPANMFPVLAKENGANLVIINREPTELDSLADYTIQDMNIKQFLTELNQSL